MTTTVKVIRDNADFPSVIKIRHHGRTVELNYDRNVGFTVTRGRLTSGIIDLLKLIYPYAEKTLIQTYDSGFMAQEEVIWGPNANVTLYTIPEGKRLFILNYGLCTTKGGGAGPLWPWGQLYLWDPLHGVSITLANHYFESSQTGTQALTSSGTQIDKSFKAGWEVTGFAGLNTICYASFIGVLLDA